MTAAAGTSWVCCHLGAREHYAVPRALHHAGRLALLVTDAWSPPHTRRAALASAMSARLGQRFHTDLAGTNVRSLTRSLILHEAGWRLRRRHGWDLVLARNEWFQAQAAAVLPQTPSGQRTILFAHSYSARRIFAEARRRGWTTVLGQIDPGPEHFATLERLAAAHPEFGPAPPAPPPAYFAQWRNECELADWIVVNSDWSRESLLRAGVPERKLKTIPLAYEPEANPASGTRQYPARFSSERPLRALFVGTASVAKGIGDLLRAFAALGPAPIELRLVGECAMRVPERFANDPRIHWTGPVDRLTVMAHYRASDLLVFPSHSDGFGMAQIEAQGWALPIVASRNCGRVVSDEETGLLLSDVTPATIAAALQRAIDAPEMLARFSANISAKPGTGIPSLAAALRALETA